MQLNKISINDIDVRNKHVLMRADFNVPLDDNRNVTDDTRIKAALPSINYLLDHGAKLVLVSHLGRPKGTVKEELRMDPVAVRLGELLGKTVLKADDIIGTAVKDKINSLKSGDVLLLENVRFNPGEKANDEDLAKELTEPFDVYINDAFGTAHRAHCSTVGVTKYISKCAAGFLMQKEIDYLGKALYNPQHPYVAILGGAKVSDKIPVIEQLLNVADTIIIGGAMAYTFLKIQGYKIGGSLFEENMIETSKSILRKAENLGKEILLPVDHFVTEKIDSSSACKVTQDNNILDNLIAVDIGPKTVSLYGEKISAAEMIVWNGPMGIFEIEQYSVGTFEIARYIAQGDNTSIIGGGDSVAAINKSGLNKEMSHISTGGGASLQFLEGKPLPGIEALTDKM